jgi:RNA polymerase sigma factor (sigma-70 family)
VSIDAATEQLLRELVPQVLGTLIRRFGYSAFDQCEDAVQEALLAAFVQWPDQGVPKQPRSWLITVASHRLTDQWRSDTARERRETAVMAEMLAEDRLAPAPEDERLADQDEILTLLFLCCHPVLSPASQVALTLRAVGGLTTRQIASAFLVPESTMAQRLSRAKQRIKVSSIPFRLPPEPEQAERLSAVLQVLYLIFNEGYTASAGPTLGSSELTNEAIRMARALHRLLPEEGEVAGLLALMLLTDARHPARARPDGTLIPLAEQDRGLWNQVAIQEGVALLMHTLTHAPLGPYQLQAAIMAVHDEAAQADETDWEQLLALYALLERMAPNPMITLNRAVALAMLRGPQAGLALLATLDADEHLAGHYRLDAVRAHLLEMAGDERAARTCYQRAARRTTSIPEQRYLEMRAVRLVHDG